MKTTYLILTEILKESILCSVDSSVRHVLKEKPKVHFHIISELKQTGITSTAVRLSASVKASVQSGSEFRQHTQGLVSILSTTKTFKSPRARLERHLSSDGPAALW